jgi:endonuclease/exonuclease/phosphatase family metal-dependent hydrolase
VIVAGDTNLRTRRDGDALTRLIEGAGLTDSCDAVRCDDAGRIDRIFVRSGDAVILAVKAWRRDDTFVDEEGRGLSDHRPIVVEVEWKRAKTTE